MKKALILLLGIATLTAGGWFADDRIRFDRAAWLSDYEQLRAAVETHYANLKWSRASKNVDLVLLNQTALEELQRATSNSTARRALHTFAAGFNDAHFHIERNPPRVVASVLARFGDENVTPSIDFGMTAANACSALGFAAESHDLAVEGATPLANSTFAAGMLTSRRGRKFGVIRIPLFQQREYG